jgi:hypothetical protein
VHQTPDLKLSEEAFPTATATLVEAEIEEEEEVAEDTAEEELAEEVVAGVELEEVGPADAGEEPADEAEPEQSDTD